MTDFRKDKRGVVWMLVPNRPQDHTNYQRVRCVLTCFESVWNEGDTIAVTKEKWEDMEFTEDPRPKPDVTLSRKDFDFLIKMANRAPRFSEGEAERVDKIEDENA
jgi:hypothetical protein